MDNLPKDNIFREPKKDMNVTAITKEEDIAEPEEKDMGEKMPMDNKMPMGNYGQIEIGEDGMKGLKNMRVGEKSNLKVEMTGIRKEGEKLIGTFNIIK